MSNPHEAQRSTHRFRTAGTSTRPKFTPFPGNFLSPTAIKYWQGAIRLPQRTQSVNAMPHFPRIEDGTLTNLTTTKTRQHELWFLCDQRLEHEILGHLAQCCERYSVKPYALSLEGTHKHELLQFPLCNRAAFFRDFNSATARAIKHRYSIKGPGAVLGSRYSQEFVLTNEDVEREFFYVVLQPVQDGLVPSIYDYPGYNCFEDAIHERERLFPVFDRARYNAEKRWKKDIKLADYTTYVSLKFQRLPGYEQFPQAEYVALMRKKLRERTRQLNKERRAEGKGYLGREKLLATIPGSRAKNPKVSTRWGFRPRIICSCSETSAKYLKWYFSILDAYRRASKLFLATGDISQFPPGTYLPPRFTVHQAVTASDLD